MVLRMPKTMRALLNNKMSSLTSSTIAPAGTFAISCFPLILGRLPLSVPIKLGFCTWDFQVRNDAEAVLRSTPIDAACVAVDRHWELAARW